MCDHFWGLGAFAGDWESEITKISWYDMCKKWGKGQISDREPK